MILWTSKVETEPKVVIDHMGLRSWRWVLEVAKWGISLHREISCQPVIRDYDSYRNPPVRETYGPPSEWRQIFADYFDISITSHAFWGRDHNYYDGPHCSFSIGYVHFNWSYWWCKKCMPD